MARVKYIDKRFNNSSIDVIQQAVNIVDEYQAAGLRLTLRQLYYQFVSRDLLPNSDRQYRRLSSIISDARLAGLIDWLAIEDRTRNLQRNAHWNSPGEIVNACANQFKMDRWRGQDVRVEVWIEKEALLGVIDTICRQVDVDFFACKGYVSQSEMWNAAQRFRQYNADGQGVILIHLGDHDPSGIDMTRDIEDRMSLFGVTDIEVQRIALTIDQVHYYNPPPNPAKLTDSRAADYMREYGRSSWELDALDPKTIRTLIHDKVIPHRDMAVYDEVKKEEAEAIETLKTIAKQYGSM